MSDREKIKGKVIDLFSKSKIADKPSISVIGNGNTVAGRDVVIETKKVVHKTVANTSPGIDHITEEQAATLKRLVDEIVATEKKLKKRPKGYNAVWGALNASMKVGQYRLIPIEKYDSAEKYLRKWIGRLNSAVSAPKKDPNWRKKRYSHNHTVAKKYGFTDRMRAYMLDKFGVTSQRDLDNDELDQLYRRMAAWKRAAK